MYSVSFRLLVRVCRSRTTEVIRGEHFQCAGSAGEAQRKMAVFPEAYSSVSSLVNLSRSRRMMVPSSSTSSEQSVTLTDRQVAMCRSSPEPNTPSKRPATAHSATWPPCNGVNGRPLTCGRQTVRIRPGDKLLTSAKSLRSHPEAAHGEPTQLAHSPGQSRSHRQSRGER